MLVSGASNDAPSEGGTVMVIQLEGYGASIAFDGTYVTIIPGKAERKLWGVDHVSFPITDVISIKYRAANPMVNGEMSFETIQRAEWYVGDTTRTYQSVADNGLNVHWRRKDRVAFDDLHEQLAAFVNPDAADGKRVLAVEARAQFDDRRIARAQASADQFSETARTNWEAAHRA